MEVREPAVAYGKNISIADYLEMENTSLEKHEYCRGEIFAMEQKFRITLLLKI